MSEVVDLSERQFVLNEGICESYFVLLDDGVDRRPRNRLTLEYLAPGLPLYKIRRKYYAITRDVVGILWWRLTLSLSQPVVLLLAALIPSNVFYCASSCAASSFCMF